MSKKENIEQIIEYLLKQIKFQKDWLRSAQHDYDDAVAENASEIKIKIRQEMLDRRKNELLSLESMINFMQELHYEEESK